MIPRTTTSSKPQTPTVGHAPKWIPPPAGITECNVNAVVSRAGGKGAVAMILRDGDCRYVGSSDMVFDDVMDPPTLEALACQEALHLADDLLVIKIMVANDCQQIIKDIADDSGGCYAPIIKEIGLHRRDFETALFTHEGWKSNTDVHNLARHALSLMCGY
jgi:hypothetical protein